MIHLILVSFYSVRDGGVIDHVVHEHTHPPDLLKLRAMLEERTVIDNAVASGSLRKATTIQIFAKVPVWFLRLIMQIVSIHLKLKIYSYKNQYPP